MTSVGPTTQLISIIRDQLIKSSTGFSTPSNKVKKTETKEKSSQSLFNMTAKRIRTIDRDDPSRNRKAFKYFLESVLLGELGEEMINDPAFYQLVDQVQKTMESDSRISAQIDEAGKMLLHLHSKDVGA